MWPVELVQYIEVEIIGTLPENFPFLYLHVSLSLLSSQHCGLDGQSLVPRGVLVPRALQVYRSPQFLRQSYLDWSEPILTYSWDVLPLGPILFYGSPSSAPHPPQAPWALSNHTYRLRNLYLDKFVFTVCQLF